VFDCSPAYHGGLHPPFSTPATATWTHVATRTPGSGIADSNGLTIHPVNDSRVLPSACWRLDPANGQRYAALRATQQGGPAGGLYTFTQSGLSCLANAYTNSGSWAAWLGEGCHRTYSNSSNHVPFVIIRATS
jgi:hypothetical protein